VDSFEIVVTVLAGEDTQEAQQLSQNDDHDNDQGEEENNEEEEEEEGNKAEGEDDEDYTPLSDVEKDEMFHDTDEIKTVENEAPIPTDRLRDLLNHLNINTQPEFRIKTVLHHGREEYKAIVEIFSGPNVLSRHKGPAFRAT
jgi:cobalamin biosynthesis protein CobT